MQTSTSDLISVLVIGTVVLTVLTVSIFLFVIIYQKRMITHQAQLQVIQGDKQRELMEAIFETQENERKRLAEDLHDSVGQVLSAIKLNIHRLDRQLCLQSDPEKVARTELLQDTKTLVEDCIVEIRNIIRNILPPVLTDFGIGEALQDLCVKVAAITGIKVNFNSEGASIQLKKEIELLIYRIIQELFNNSIKHAEATEINLSLLQIEHSLSLIYEDNGKGFEIDNIKHGYGLKNMESRTQMLNGKISINSDPGKGTRIKITIDL